MNKSNECRTGPVKKPLLPARKTEDWKEAHTASKEEEWKKYLASLKEKQKEEDKRNAENLVKNLEGAKIAPSEILEKIKEINKKADKGKLTYLASPLNQMEEQLIKIGFLKEIGKVILKDRQTKEIIVRITGLGETASELESREGETFEQVKLRLIIKLEEGVRK